MGVAGSFTATETGASTSAGPDGVVAGSDSATGDNVLVATVTSRPGPTTMLAVQPSPIAATRLAAHAAARTRRRRVCTRSAASPPSISKLGGMRRGGARLASRAVVRSRSAAMPSRVARQDEHPARWLSISTH
jgi:hypothetical protein